MPKSQCSYKDQVLDCGSQGKFSLEEKGEIEPSAKGELRSAKKRAERSSGGVGRKAGTLSLAWKRPKDHSKALYEGISKGKGTKASADFRRRYRNVDVLLPRTERRQ